MANNHILTREIGNLRGFSSNSIYVNPPNVADRAINLQKAPDETLQIRRGYQCQIAEIGGLGNGTFDDPESGTVREVTLGLDGFLYQKLTKQIFFDYDGRVTGEISGATNGNPTRITSNSHNLQSGTFTIIRDISGAVDLNNFTYIIDVINPNEFDLYSLQNTGSITFASQSNPCQITSINHGLTTGNQIMISEINGMVQLNDISYTITVIDPNNFTLDGIDSTLFSSYVSGGIWYLSNNNSSGPSYTSGGYWSIAFADQRYLNFTIFTDPRYLVTNPGWSVQPWSLSPWGTPSGESITCNIIVNRAAQVNGIFSNVNTVTVDFGHELATGDVIQFTDVNGVAQQRNVTGTTSTSVTFDGAAVSVGNNTFINQYFDIPFRKGFDVVSPYLISTFIATITDATNGVEGLQVSINGDSSYPAAFLQILEPVIIDSNSTFSIDYWYWSRCNATMNPTFPGSANIAFQNSPDFENASMAVFEDVLYVANGWDYPQKFDGQTVYRAGMPRGVRPIPADNTGASITPFAAASEYEYAVTYEQVDALGHIVEGELSLIRSHTVGGSPAAIDVTVNNILPLTGWNTNGAIATGGAATVYGPDGDGFYYDFVDVSSGFTLKVGDSAYYLDERIAQIDGAQANVLTITVDAGHGIEAGDTVYFLTSTPTLVQRVVVDTSATSITIEGEPVTVSDNDYIWMYDTSQVFADVAIVNGDQTDVNTITVDAGHNIQVNDVVSFENTQGDIVRRNVSAVAGTSITIDQIPVDVLNGTLISSENQRATQITLRRNNASAAYLGTSAPISNSLKINIYRTLEGQSFLSNAELFLVASIPNNSDGTAIQTFLDYLPDAELGRVYDDPDRPPNPPPICKYLKSFGTQLFFAGGERGNPENSDRVFYSEGNSPEYVPLATNSYAVPNTADNVTGIGVAGTTLVTTKNESLWAATGNFLDNQVEVVQIAAGSNIGCVAHASIATVGTLMYFLHTNGVYAITENQLYPTDNFGNPVPLSLAIDRNFRETSFLPQTRQVFKRAVAVNYTKDNQYLLFVPSEDVQSTIRTANSFSRLYCYDYKGKNWFLWQNINAAGGMYVVNDDLYFQERRFSGVDGNTANLYKQHRFYRLVDHADHTGPQRVEWRSSWEDLGQPQTRKKFSTCVLLMDRLSSLYQYNNPQMQFSSYLDRIPDLQNTISNVTQVDNIRNSSWSNSSWGWGFWSGYQDSFIRINLKRGTVAKSMQIGFTLVGINQDIRFAGFQLEAIPENRRTMTR